MTGHSLAIRLCLWLVLLVGFTAPTSTTTPGTSALAGSSPTSAAAGTGTVDTSTLHAVWTVHVDPGPPWDDSTSTYELGCDILDRMATVFESHGISMYVAVSWNFNNACQLNSVLPGAVTDLAARGHDIGVHEHQGASLADQFNGLTSLAGFAPVCMDGIGDYDELVSLGFSVGAGPGKDVSTQLSPLSTRSFRGDKDDHYVEDPDALLLGFAGGSFDGQSFEPDETANMTAALLYDLSRMVTGKLHSWTVVTHPDEYVGLSPAQLTAAMDSLDDWLTDDVDPLVASGQLTWTTKRAFEQTYAAWVAEGGTNDDLFPDTLEVRKPGWSAWTTSDTSIVSDEVAGLDVAATGDVWVGAGTISGGGLSLLANDMGDLGDPFDPGDWSLIQSNPGGMLSDKPLFLFSDASDGLWASMATEPAQPGQLGLSRWDGSLWTSYPALSMGYSGGSPGFVWEAAVDQSGWLWVGTGQGVARLIGNSWTFFKPVVVTPQPGTMPLSHRRIYRVAVGPDGRKWFGTLGGGIDVLDDQGTPTQFDDVWNHYDQPELPSGNLRSLTFDADGNVWAGTQRGAAFFDTSLATWTLFDEATSGLSHDQVTAIHVDARGDVWFGTYGLGVSRLRPSTNLWDTYSAAGGELLGSYIFDISEDSSGRMLFTGYHGGGMAVFEQRLSYAAPPSLGQSFELDVRGTAGDGVLLLVSAVTADLQSNAWGTLLVDPTLSLQIPLAPIPVSGKLTVSFPIPNDPALLGPVPIYLQAFTYSSLGPAVGQLTNRQSFVFVN
jgi:hypothetical protein